MPGTHAGLKIMDEDVQKGFAKAGAETATHHLFLCLGPDCCAPANGDAAWNHLKQRVSRLELSVMRTKAGCFRICAQGPWLLVYPEGTWYGQITPEKIDRILEEHIHGGKPIHEWITLTHPLPVNL
jgi:(2Fe-2S) ferredoxin